MKWLYITAGFLALFAATAFGGLATLLRWIAGAADWLGDECTGMAFEMAWRA